MELDSYAIAPGEAVPARANVARESNSDVAQVQRFPLVQTFRGIAAVWVVLFHIAEGRHIPGLLAALPHWLGYILFGAGHFGVPIFFALSGFVIAHSLRGVQLSPRTFGRFVLRRSLRLDPPYWMSIVFAVTIAFISATAKHAQFVPTDGETLLVQGFYLQYILGFPSPNAVYWTLAYEVQFYLFFVALMTLVAVSGLRNGQRTAWVFMMVLAIASALHAFHGVHTGIFVNLWATFFAGVLAYHAIDHRVARVAGAILLVTMVCTGDTFMAVSAGTAAILFAAARLGWAQRPPFTPVGQWLGAISYSLYLLHNPISGAMDFVARRFLGTSLLAETISLFLMLAACLAGSYVFWLAIERPSHWLSRRISLG